MPNYTFTHHMTSRPISSVPMYIPKPSVSLRKRRRCSRYRITSSGAVMSCCAVRPRSCSHAASEKMSFPVLICPVSSMIGPSYFVSAFHHIKANRSLTIRGLILSTHSFSHFVDSALSSVA